MSCLDNLGLHLLTHKAHRPLCQRSLTLLLTHQHDYFHVLPSTSLPFRKRTGGIHFSYLRTVLPSEHIRMLKYFLPLNKQKSLCYCNVLGKCSKPPLSFLTGNKVSILATLPTPSRQSILNPAVSVPVKILTHVTPLPKTLRI